MKSEPENDAEINEIVGIEYLFRLERADNGRTRQLHWHPTQSTNVRRKLFRNEKAFEALCLAAESLHGYDECNKFVLGYENGNEMILNKNYCLSLLFRYKPISVLVFIKTNGLNRGTLVKVTD